MSTVIPKQEGPTFETERTLYSQGYKCIAGVDEVGRGPWAGPVVAAAVILNPNNLPAAQDSKKLNAQKREVLAQHIIQTAHVAFGEASVEEIDQFNIRQATFMAMQRAVAALPHTADYVLIDGNVIPPNLPCAAQFIIKGDSKSLSIAAASIVAKVKRDAYMSALHKQFPHFGWNSNSGYGTKIHQNGLKIHGITPHHRRSFRPIKELIGV